jgi:hypothetical protein
VAQGIDGAGRIGLQRSLAGLLAEIAVAAAQVAVERGHVKQVDVAREHSRCRHNSDGFARIHVRLPDQD